MNLESALIFMVKIRFPNSTRSYFVHRVACSVHVDRVTRDMVGLGNAFRRGPVLNHPLVITIIDSAIRTGNSGSSSKGLNTNYEV